MYRVCLRYRQHVKIVYKKDLKHVARIFLQKLPYYLQLNLDIDQRLLSETDCFISAEKRMT